MRPLVLALLLAGCGKTGVIVIDVESNATFKGLSKLEVHVTNGGSPEQMFTLPLPQSTIPPAQTFSLSFDGDRSGDTTITIYAIDGTGAKVAGVTDHADLTPGKVVNLREFLRTSCGDTFADLPTDGKNCGACGHSCFGGACANGACQPAIVAKADHPHGCCLAVDGASVYWAEWDFQAKNGRLMRAPLGGMPTPIVPLTEEPWHIATDGKTLFLGSMAGMQSVPATGGSLTVIAPMAGGGNFIVDHGYLYWSGPMGFQRRSLSDNTDAVLLGGVYVNSVAVTADQKTAFYVGAFPNRMTPAVVKVPLDGSAPTALADEPGFGAGAALDAASFYWISADNTGPGPLKSIPLGGGTSDVVANGKQIYGLAGDGKSVYWNNAGVVYALPSGGGMPVALTGSAHNAANLVDGGDSLYFLDWNGQNIVRLAK